MRRSPRLQSLVMVSGLSGSGKHTVFEALEDLGYFCVDNIPAPMVPRLVEMTTASGGKLSRLAVVVDVRLQGNEEEFARILPRLRALTCHSTVIFVDASDQALARRYSETRRVHPLAQNRSLEEGIRRERSRLSGVLALADQVIDTSSFSVHDLRKLIYDQFREGTRERTLHLSLVSFGFKYGLPFQADLVFDVRYLPNPHFDQSLRDLSGQDPPVVAFMNSNSETGETIDRFSDMLKYLLPRYLREGKTYLTVGVGCTGGRHRSVMVVEALGDCLKQAGYSPNLVHRDIHRDE